MKKILTMTIIVLMAGAFAQMDISRNRVMGALALKYDMQTVDSGGEDVTAATMSFAVPDVNYEFEAKPSDMFKLYLYGNLGYYMDKTTVDGEAPDSLDVFASQMLLNLNPKGKVYLPNDLFGMVELPFYYINSTPQEEDADAIPVMDMNAVVSFGYDTRDIYIHGLTPWNDFEKGIYAYAFYDIGLMTSVDGEDVEELESFFGIYAAYAHYADAMMIKPYLKYKMGMNDKVDEDSYLHIGANFAKDFNEQINVQANLDFEMWMLADAPVGMEDAYNYLNIDAMASYYVMPELAVGAGFGMWMDMTTEDANPVYTIMAGAEYTLDLIK